MLKPNKKREHGFTIIEVLIVLAIAGLILLIVFLAVPALQRNSRNTQRRSDVSRMLGAMQEATNNNSGSVPTGSTAPTQVTDKLGIYTSSDVDYLGVSGTGTALGTMDTSKVYLRNGLKCGAAVSAGASSTSFTITGLTSTTGATSRNIVAIYAVETTGNNVQPQCQES
ncbi:MAG TPA: prepilin-type N-terminal cleavage/methylation domain-containing protein [Candidatus Saccharimonadales bacterium]|nr:prepilin-type N-terminal cleavage/methylation domain-containing protein [Candidatus Saccharimonadales bacterium]